MLGRSCVPIVLLVGTVGLVHAQGERTRLRVQRLIRDFREPNPLGTPRTNEQLRILKELARLDDRRAVRFLVGVARDPNYNHLWGDLLVILAGIDRDSDKMLISNLMREHMGLDDPYRAIARDRLLKQAIREANDEWLIALFAMGTHEDKFLALQGLGRIGSTTTLETAWSLVRDRTWKPRRGTVVNCGTIAASVERIEGPEAARLLLILTKDSRFTEADARVLRETTRLWRQRDLRKYIDIAELAAPDTTQRVEAATFLGRAGIDAAREPLVRLARNRHEPPVVRAAAAEALGGLRLAKGDLARTLDGLLRDPDALVRQGAIAGLARLSVRQAAAALVELLDGPQAARARAALAEMTGLAAETDWRAWLRSPRCTLPEGT